MVYHVTLKHQAFGGAARIVHPKGLWWRLLVSFIDLFYRSLLRYIGLFCESFWKYTGLVQVCRFTLSTWALVALKNVFRRSLLRVSFEIHRSL